MSELQTFAPDWASPPGATINDLLLERGKSVVEFAHAIGNSLDHAQRLISGSIQITEEIADRLALFFGVSANFWLARESQFREGLARISRNEDWLNEIPVNDLIKFKWIKRAEGVRDKIAACLDFFDVPTVSDWHIRYEGQTRLTAFRSSKSFDPAEGAVLAWLRKGEIESAKIECSDWNPEQFHKALPAIRALTRQKDPSKFIPELQQICSECGVAVVIVRAPTGCIASGATRFLTGTKALMMLSFRYLSDDHFWFTFFHEAGHLLLHDSRELFLEGGDLCSGEEETEANNFSSNMLIPIEYQSAMRTLPLDGRAVMRFARNIGVSPGIVVGQLQHQGIFNQRQLNNLKIRYRWSDD